MRPKPQAIVQQREGILTGGAGGAGGYKPIKANLQPSHGTKDSLLGKKYPTTRNTVFILLVFKSGVGTPSIGVLGVP